jgi:hypothetical protein
VRTMTDDEVAAHFPVQGWRMKCGLRTDLPKKERLHDYVKLGTEQRNTGTSHGYMHGELYACYRCGMDRFRAWKGPKLTAKQIKEMFPEDATLDTPQAP